jgi:hypothetical protein
MHLGSGESRAYQSSELRFYNDSLPHGYYAVSDNAYLSIYLFLTVEWKK